MKKENQPHDVLEGLSHDLQVFIELSFQEDEVSLQKWIDRTVNKLESRCWEIKECGEKNCPAYKNECGRCWLVAGTMCGGEPQGRFVHKFEFCTECEVFQQFAGQNPVSRLREQVIVLIHSLRSKQRELTASFSKIKVLQGFLPICASCKKIRDDSGYWNQLESYIAQHSEAEFSHSICPDCANRLYPDMKF